MSLTMVTRLVLLFGIFCNVARGMYYHPQHYFQGVQQQPMYFRAEAQSPPEEQSPKEQHAEYTATEPAGIGHPGELLGGIGISAPPDEERGPGIMGAEPQQIPEQDSNELSSKEGEESITAEPSTQQHAESTKELTNGNGASASTDNSGAKKKGRFLFGSDEFPLLDGFGSLASHGGYGDFAGQNYGHVPQALHEFHGGFHGGHLAGVGGFHGGHLAGAGGFHGGHLAGAGGFHGGHLAGIGGFHGGHLAEHLAGGHMGGFGSASHVSISHQPMAHMPFAHHPLTHVSMPATHISVAHHPGGHLPIGAVGVSRPFVPKFLTDEEYPSWMIEATKRPLHSQLLYGRVGSGVYPGQYPNYGGYNFGGRFGLYGGHGAYGHHHGSFGVGFGHAISRPTMHKPVVHHKPVVVPHVAPAHVVTTHVGTGAAHVVAAHHPAAVVASHMGHAVVATHHIPSAVVHHPPPVVPRPAFAHGGFGISSACAACRASFTPSLYKGRRHRVLFHNGRLSILSDGGDYARAHVIGK